MYFQIILEPILYSFLIEIIQGTLILEINIFREEDKVMGQECLNLLDNNNLIGIRYLVLEEFKTMSIQILLVVVYNKTIIDNRLDKLIP